MCKVRGAGIPAGLSQGVKETQARRSQHREGTRAPKPGRTRRRVAKERRGSKLLEVVSKRKWTPLGTSAPSLAAAPRSKCEALASEGRKRGVPLLRASGSGDPGQREGQGQRPAGRLTRTLPQLWAPSRAQGRGRRWARYSLGLVGEPGGPGLLVSVQVTVEHIEAKAAHLRWHHHLPGAGRWGRGGGRQGGRGWGGGGRGRK